MLTSLFKIFWFCFGRRLTNEILAGRTRHTLFGLRMSFWVQTFLKRLIRFYFFVTQTAAAHWSYNKYLEFDEGSSNYITISSYWLPQTTVNFEKWLFSNAWCNLTSHNPTPPNSFTIIIPLSNLPRFRIANLSDFTRSKWTILMIKAGLRLLTNLLFLYLISIPIQFCYNIYYPGKNNWCEKCWWRNNLSKCESKR